MSYLDRFEQTEAMPAQKTFEQLPAGKYIAQITDIEIKDETFPECRRISVEFTIHEGESKGRKTWWNTTLSETTSEKAMAFIKRTICQMAGTDSTNGDTFGTLLMAKGNCVEIDLSYKPGIKNPEKMYSQIFVNKMVIPF